MLPLTIALLVALAIVGYLLQSARTRLADAEERLAEAVEARRRADEAATEAEAAAAAAAKERDDALERAARAKRDAAEVARRMQEEAEARAAAEAEQASTAADRERLEAELAAAEALAADGDEGRIAELWSLALGGVRRTWEVSVCPSPGMPCPLDDGEHLLRTALEIEVDAAREEAGAAIELRWEGDAEVATPTALRTLSIAQELIGRLSKVADEATMAVEVADDGSLVLAVVATDADGADVVPPDVAAEHLDGAGRYVLGA